MSDHVARTTDTAVVGAGVVGAAVAYGLARCGHRVILLDEGDTALRASRGNGGLVWVQNKGLGLPAYTRLSLRSALLWPEFARKLREDSGIDVAYERRGGLQCCLSESGAARRASEIEQMRSACHNDGLDIRMMDRDEIKSLEPRIGPEVVAASYSPHDGAADPIKLLRALHTALQALGAPVSSGPPVDAIEPTSAGYRLSRGAESIEAGRVIVAAGLGTRKIAGRLGVDLPIRPQKGQAIITERVAGRQKVFIIKARQTNYGHFILGSSVEDNVADLGTDLEYVGPSVAHSLRILPFLRKARVLRTWAAYRVMTRDSFPLYGQLGEHPGLQVAICHSGITLAAFHALELPRILTGDLGLTGIASFSSNRFEEAA